MASAKRYDGRPILIIIENYVMGVIGELDTAKHTAIAGVVQSVWGSGADWMGTVRKELGWEKSIDDAIHENWRDYQKTARQQGTPGSAVEFAMMFADAVEKQSREPIKGS